MHFKRVGKIWVSLSRKRSLKILLPALLIFAIVGIILINTRFGVFLVFDVLADITEQDQTNATADDGPLRLDKVLQIKDTIVLDPQIEQVSGIYVSDGHFAVSTDQSELFLLNTVDDPDILERRDLLPWQPLLFKQGIFEGLTYYQQNYALVGEYPALVTVHPKAAGKIDFDLPLEFQQREFTGLTTNGNRLFLTEAESVNIFTYGAQGQAGMLKVDFSGWFKSGKDPTLLRWSGISYSQGLLYMVGENYPIITVVVPDTGQVKAVYGVDGANTFSDISVSEGLAYLPSDHNLFDPRPPIRIVRLID